MTIAEKIHNKQPEMLQEIAIRYKLDWIMQMFFPKMERADIEESEIRAMMMPGQYTGKVGKRRGRYRQEHRGIYK